MTIDIIEMINIFSLDVLNEFNIPITHIKIHSAANTKMEVADLDVIMRKILPIITNKLNEYIRYFIKAE